uniref:Uncharacterized protein n=1 Tax=Zea mays TaxID=4577 RepID=A0A804QCH2_MAIZE
MHVPIWLGVRAQVAATAPILAEWARSPAHTLVMLAVDVGTGCGPTVGLVELVNTHDLEMLQLEGSGKIYAQGDDYHEYFKRSFEEDIAAQVPQGVEWGYNY